MPAYKDTLDLVGHTPLVMLGRATLGQHAEVYAKLEGFNPWGSVKDRAVVYILRRALEENLITAGTTVVESSSGNFAVALAAACRMLDLRCICVIDPNVTAMNRFLLEQMGAQIELVTQPDSAGGFLKSRLRRVGDLRQRLPNCFWTNQYANPWNALAHYHGTGREIYDALGGRIDYLFATVSSGGTLTGCARYLKERLDSIRVVAVDAAGSAIFGDAPQPRHIPGAGSSIVPEVLDMGLIDDVVHVPEIETVRACHWLLRKQGLFVGGSSGTVVAGMWRYFQGHERAPSRPPVAVAIFPDRGERYFDTVYNREWVERVFGERVAA